MTETSSSFPVSPPVQGERPRGIRHLGPRGIQHHEPRRIQRHGEALVAPSFVKRGLGELEPAREPHPHRRAALLFLTHATNPAEIDVNLAEALLRSPAIHRRAFARFSPNPKKKRARGNQSPARSSIRALTPPTPSLQKRGLFGPLLIHTPRLFGPFQIHARGFSGRHRSTPVAFRAATDPHPTAFRAATDPRPAAFRADGIYD
ncbi:MAG: hypothetical protein DIJKHBIC_02189 [Thermoanaerobaculia bacterium]|nr:hypothetical protein [Thermoanaerobaculia bacterium]